MGSRTALLLWLLAAARGVPGGQVIQFESSGLKFQTLTKRGMTVMFAHLPVQLREYAILQVSVSNGSAVPITVRPEDFSFHRPDGSVVTAAPAPTVVTHLLARGSRDDVMKLVATYEATLYGIPGIRSTNGYEQRRLSAQAEFTSTKLKAAATASALALVEAKLARGQSTDGAVFFPSEGKPLGAGWLRLRLGGESFEFASDPDLTKTLRPSRVGK